MQDQIYKIKRVLNEKIIFKKVLIYKNKIVSSLLNFYKIKDWYMIQYCITHTTNESTWILTWETIHDCGKNLGRMNQSKRKYFILSWPIELTPSADNWWMCLLSPGDYRCV